LKDVQIEKSPLAPAHYVIKVFTGQQWHLFNFFLDVT